VDYLSELCVHPLSHSSSSRHSLRSRKNYQFVVPLVKLSTYGIRSINVAELTIFNSLPDYLRNPTLFLTVFKHYLKINLFTNLHCDATAWPGLALYKFYCCFLLSLTLLHLFDHQVIEGNFEDAYIPPGRRNQCFLFLSSRSITA